MQQRGLQRPLSDTCRVGLAPTAAYALLVADGGEGSGRRLLGRLGQTLLVLGVTVAIMATGRVTLQLVSTLMAAWSFVLIIQVITAIGLVRSSAVRPVSALRALDLWFAAQLPYNLWMIALALLVFVWDARLHVLALLSAAIPAAWTVVIALAYCRQVLGVSASGALVRVLAHQSATWATVAVYVLFAAGGVGSVTSWLARRLG